MATMFEIAKPMLAQVGMVVGRDWQATKRRTLGYARAQLRRENLKRATIVKWHRLGYLAQDGQRPVI